MLISQVAPQTNPLRQQGRAQRALVQSATAPSEPETRSRTFGSLGSTWNPRTPSLTRRATGSLCAKVISHAALPFPRNCYCRFHSNLLSIARAPSPRVWNPTMRHPMLAGLILGLLALTGCSRAVATPTVLREQTVNVSAEDRSVPIDGKQIALDGLPPDETATLKVTHFRTSDGQVGVDIDSASAE